MRKRNKNKCYHCANDSVIAVFAPTVIANEVKQSHDTHSVIARSETTKQSHDIFHRLPRHAVARNDEVFQEIATGFCPLNDEVLQEIAMGFCPLNDETHTTQNKRRKK